MFSVIMVFILFAVNMNYLGLEIKTSRVLYFAYYETGMRKLQSMS